MSDGYQIIESEELASLIAKTAHDQFSVAILYWLAEQLNLLKTGHLSDLHFEVIRVQYVSRYPTIGVKYLGSGQEDREQVILNAISEIMRNTNLQTFVEHIVRRNSWRTVASELLGE